MESVLDFDSEIQGFGSRKILEFVFGYLRDPTRCIPDLQIYSTGGEGFRSMESHLLE